MTERFIVSHMKPDPRGPRPAAMADEERVGLRSNDAEITEKAREWERSNEDSDLLYRVHARLVRRRSGGRAQSA